MGGSFIALDRYLKHCDPQRFRHEVAFYRRPGCIEARPAGDCPVVDLGLPVPLLSDAARAPSARGLRKVLHSMPRLQRLARCVLSIWRLASSLPNTVRLAKVIRERHYAIIHCNNNFGYQPQTLLAAWLAHKPLLAHYRTIQPLTRLERLLARLPRCVAAINETGAEHLRAAGIRTPVVVCRDIIEAPIPFTPQERLAVRAGLARDGDLLIGTVSRLEDSKGVKDLLGAVRILATRWPQLRCVIVGEGTKASLLKRMTAELALQDRVCFAGFVSNQFVYYACMDIFVCPSLAEGGPLTVIEAMQMGCPVVSTEVGQVAEWIGNGESGLLVPPGDAESLARAIDSLLSSPEQRVAMAAKAAEKARAFLDSAARARELDDVFAQIVGGR